MSHEIEINHNSKAAVLFLIPTMTVHPNLPQLE